MDRASGPSEVRGIRRVHIPQHADKVFAGRLFSIYQWREHLFDGTETIFEMAQRPDNVVVLAIDRSGKILVTRQEQPGIADVFHDFPGGRIEPGERRSEAAARELLEETGFAAERMELIHEFQPSDRVDSLTSVFRATGLAEIGNPLPDSGERVTVLWMELNEIHQRALANNRLAILPIMLARSIDDLITSVWRT